MNKNNNNFETADKFYNVLNNFLSKNIDYLYYLKDRWHDEKEYEDFDDYKKAITKKLDECGITPHSISKSFTIKFLYKNTHSAEIKLASNGKAQLKLIKLAE